METAYLRAVDKHRDLILHAERHLWAHPETGYREWRTSAYLAAEFERLGYTVRPAGNIPGFCADMDTGRPGPCVLVFSEMDALLCGGHPQADKQTQAVHACGHHAQCAALIGLAAALREPGALDELSGMIRLCAVPAEELIEIAYREDLRQQGLIRFYGGKVEFMRRGFFQDVDMALMLHVTGGDKRFILDTGGNGCVAKWASYLGTAMHASAASPEAVNALYAATLGLQAVNSLRATFPDTDHIRVHPIVTKGGETVNIIPDEVTLESYVRGASMEAIKRVNAQVNQALAGAAAALGARLLLRDRPGYAPLNNDENFRQLAVEAMRDVVTAEEINLTRGWNPACTDMGDISAVMPALMAYVGGAEGVAHGVDYAIASPEIACVDAAKALLAILRRLLIDDAASAKKIIAEKKTAYPSMGAYFEDMEALAIDRDAVLYEDDAIRLSR